MTFNVDIAEGIGNEELLLPYVDLCNISCGIHAGSLEETRNAIILAKKMNIKVGAHPSYPDRKNFGRRKLNISKDALKQSIKHQLSSFKDICVNENVLINHVKPHGALYHEIANSNNIAHIFFDVLKELSLCKTVIGVPNSLFKTYCNAYDFKFIAEGFADRAYEKNGSLRQRTLQGAVLSNQSEINEQVYNLIKHKSIRTFDNHLLIMPVDTICFHGDHNTSGKILKNTYKYIKNEL